MPQKKNDAKKDILQWVEKEVQLKELKPYERNPRRISKEQFALLKKSLEENGYHQRILATTDLRIIGGHQRIQALRELGIKQLKVLVPDREISDEQFKEILIKDNLPFGEFDFDILSSDFSAEQLIGWGMPKDWLPDFEPAGEEDQGKLDKISEKEVICPACGEKFDANAHKTET